MRLIFELILPPVRTKARYIENGATKRSDPTAHDLCSRLARCVCTQWHWRQPGSLVQTRTHRRHLEAEGEEQFNGEGGGEEGDEG